MHMEAFAFGHMALIAIGTSVAVARVVAWILDRREHTASAQIREQAFVAQASADLAATGWSAEDEAAFQAIRAQQGVSLKHLQEVRRA